MLWETHAFTKAIPFYGDGTTSKPNKRVTRNMGGRTWDGFFRTVLLDAEDGVIVQFACRSRWPPLASLEPPALHTPLLSYYSPSPSLRSTQISILFPASTHHAPLPSRVSVLYSANVPAEKPPCDSGWAKDRVPITCNKLAYKVTE